MLSARYAFVLSLSIISLTSDTAGASIKGCTAPYTLPNLPYFVVWNVPSGGCEEHGIDLNLTAYGIITNPNDKFVGDNMVIFYDLGDWPYYRGNTSNNGGIPQAGSLPEHILKSHQSINKFIPNDNFNGLAVVDMEAWRPLFNMNFGGLSIYQRKSIERVQKQHPTWSNKTQILNEAAKQWNIHARWFMQMTLQVARQMRPWGYWGYYGYPRCWGGASNTSACPSPATQQTNDEIAWLWGSSSALFPRIYTNNKSPIHDRYLYIRQTVNESLRVQAKWMGLDTPIMPYTLNQNSGTDFFTQKDLQVAIAEPAEMGASGTVIWGSHDFFHTKDECLKMQADIKNVLGPFVKKLTGFFQGCARDLCNSHGRCVRKDYETTTQNYLRLYQKEACLRPSEEYEQIGGRRKLLFAEKYGVLKTYDKYVCRCLAGWTGEYCANSR